MSCIDLMKKRVSVRTYSDIELSSDILDKVNKTIADAANPFGAETRFVLLSNENVKGRLGTYGFIRGPKSFIAGCVKEGQKNLEGYGYAFEKIILELTGLGLGTCWLGGTFQRGKFSKSIGLEEGEILPAATPFGYAGSSKSLTEKIVAAGAGARTRKSFDELFFEEDFLVPLKDIGEDLKTSLEMVRIAPSASNKQPWRALRQGGDIHFYLAKTRNYSGNTAFGFCMQRIDLGIAACHFDLAAKELGITGRIAVNDPGIDTQYEYSFSWQGAQ